MKKVLAALACLAAAMLLLGPVGSCAEERSVADVLVSAIENAAELDLSDGNLKVGSYDSKISTKDEKFMGLLRAKLRLSSIFSQLSYREKGFTFRNGYELVRLLMEAADSGSHDISGAPFNLGDYVIYQIVLPLGLEPLIRELPVYYDAVMSTDGWEEKFETILDDEEGWGPQLNRGKSFHLAGFPKVNKKKEYITAVDVETKDGALYYSEADSSIEAWLYSFWMRRYDEGSMDMVKSVLDWLNDRLDEVENAVG
ncbi:MAG: hypothetical protein QM441_06800 [Synergistota bacterium]|jgi:hypothetical protein|nr:hypothetical protein [Synergistota bacterium]OPZ40199.1 MAG: hypothetical protein BWY99_00975 [Synergistetes bacterium ADurb.BinA166]